MPKSIPINFGCFCVNGWQLALAFHSRPDSVVSIVLHAAGDFFVKAVIPSPPPPTHAPYVAGHPGSGINHCSSQTFEISVESCLTLDMRRCLGVAEMVPHPLVISS
jgi:hypothetical protein